MLGYGYGHAIAIRLGKIAYAVIIRRKDEHPSRRSRQTLLSLQYPAAAAAAAAKAHRATFAYNARTALARVFASPSTFVPPTPPSRERA
ncbi:hypothetical protein Forpi1262_v014326 [Fusarium oxysporum f. sp. raphani]|uniref:Uncharacterized protein n=1 Tax=Fusarium oxysporum f. sp. raphani TaxID=96318 RepID=A0A8J5U2T4_FUSOX|nr:hypothetical protein Forpi1262_v014326 [Fusarium oxysporum f. sp. raphani]